MKIGIIGTGYVGLPMGACLAELKQDVLCCDCNEDKIQALAGGEMTLYEKGLKDLFVRNRKNGRLKFTTSIRQLAEHAEVIMITVGTPAHAISGEADMQYVYAVAAELAKYLNHYTVIAIKSTVPVGVGDTVENMIRESIPHALFDVASLPEFLREGFAVQDFLHPDRIIIGTNSERARNVLQSLHETLFPHGKMLYVRRRSAEMIKYAANAFLALKIHYINEIANLCEAVDADISEVSHGIGADSRIGERFLNAGPGYGGSCLPKDTHALAITGRSNNVTMSLVESVINGNSQRKTQMAQRILEMVRHGAECPQIAILGLAFKGDTDDCRESPALEIVTELLRKNTKIIAYDPKAMPNARKILGDRVTFAQDLYGALENADIAVIMTEWEEFKSLNYASAKARMRIPQILDLRNILNPEDARRNGFIYNSIGRK